LFALKNEEVFGKESFNFNEFYERENRKSVEERLLGIEKMVKEM
jgi:hypothetical protein